MGLSKEDYKRAKKNGISKSLAFRRHEVLFWDIERAVTEKPGFKGCGWKEWENVAKKNEINYSTFWKRRKKGMTPEDAATTPKGRGSEWEKWKEIAEKNEIGYYTFRDRRIRGMASEQAATMAVEKKHRTITKEDQT